MGDSESKKIIRILDEIANLEYMDILDESDELLNPKKQLVYSVGKQSLLPFGKSRWETIQAVCHLIRFNPKIRKILKSAETIFTSHANTVESETDELCFLPSDDFEKMKPKLSEIVMDVIMESDIDCFRWLKPMMIRSPSELKRFVLNSSIICDNILRDDDFVDMSHYNQLLMLRGLLGDGLLYHGFQKRINIEIGLSTTRMNDLTRPCHMSIPYIGAMSPSERSEFSHPDLAILFTQRAWYERGLSRTELIEAFTTLTASGNLTTQTNVYSGWYNLLGRTESSEDCFAKIDLTNEVQVARLMKLYSRNMKTIDYYLNQCVYPKQTMIFPAKLAASPYDLVSGKHVCGFSGTNDSSLLLPVLVKQEESESPVLRATNGKILKTILSKTSTYATMDVTDRAKLITFILEKNVQAFIDVGAILAGVKNQDFADEILMRLDPKSSYKGVVFFEQTQNTWMFKSTFGHLYNLSNSPVKECDAIVFFDQRRCRGSDMKLRKNSIGLVTISLRLKKDDFMQACGRMRGLDYGQTLLFIGDQNVSTLIRDEVGLSKQTDVTVNALCEYVLLNVVRFVADSFSNFANNGFHFASKRADPDLCVQKEYLTCKDLYGGALINQSIADMTSQSARNFFSAAKTAKVDDSGMISLINRVDEHVRAYGSDIMRIVSTQDEECERQREKEVEKEKEVELQHQKRIPTTETVWEYSQANSTSLPLKYSFALQESIKAYLGQEFLCIDWTCDIFLSLNFPLTVTTRDLACLRRYDYFVIYSQKKIMLLTSNEANELQYEILCHYAEVSRCYLSVDTITVLKLLHGETYYTLDEQKNLQGRLKSRDAIEKIKELVGYRGNSRMLENSTLEKVFENYLQESKYKK